MQMMRMNLSNIYVGNRHDVNLKRENSDVCIANIPGVVICDAKKCMIV